ncbi:GH3 auxin-responsive promoter family protein, partial [Polaribacter sp.]|nr:GH3 auxin-responsive promoter family protein [Polaribacter sp.]
MSIKSFFAIPFAKIAIKKVNKWASNPHKTQEKVFKNLVSKASKTAFGKDHDFENIHNYADFKERVKVQDYEGLRKYVDRMVAGESDILWPGKPLYYAKTSGTTSGAKYIPITKDSMPTHIKAAKNALLSYIVEKKDASFVNGKMIFLQGSPILADKNGVKLGRLSGIVAHYIPQYLLKNRLPSWETNCIEDWDTKVNTIVEETIHEDMTVISGIPSWVQMYFEKLIEKTGKPISELFPNFNFFIYGGVNFEPYKNKFESLIGKKIDYIELYPASEGFIAYQDSQTEKG